MKKILMLIVVIIIVGVLAKPVQAAAPSSYDSTVNITNVTNTTGNITLTYYNGDGSVAATASDTINAYETKWYITLPGLSSAFNGSHGYLLKCSIGIYEYAYRKRFCR